MLDQDLFVECLYFVKSNTTVTIMQVSNELKINQVKAKEILDQIEGCNLVCNFGDFYGVINNAGLN